MNTASTLIIGNTLRSRPSSLDFIVFTGTINNLAQDTTANFSISGYDANYTSANSGAGIALRPGIYRAVNSVTFAQPITGTNTSHCNINISVSGTNSIVQPDTMQVNAEFNGWPSNNGSYCSSTVDINVPSGGVMTPAFYNAIGATISGVTLKMSLKQIRAF